MAGEGGKPLHYPRSVVVVCNTMARCRSAQLRRVWDSEPVEVGELDCSLTIPTYIYCSDETGGFPGTGGGNVASSFASAVWEWEERGAQCASLADCVTSTRGRAKLSTGTPPRVG